MTVEAAASEPVATAVAEAERPEPSPSHTHAGSNGNLAASAAGAEDTDDHHSYQTRNVADLVMLHNLSEDGIVEALQDRFKADRIYSYIGDVVISVNPFKPLAIYSDEEIFAYRDAYIVSNKAPHIYALANRAYRNLLRTHKCQCILITGESGAGKTEASKIIMQFVAVVSGTRQQQVFDQQQSQQRVKLQHQQDIERAQLLRHSMIITSNTDLSLAGLDGHDVVARHKSLVLDGEAHQPDPHAAPITAASAAAAAGVVVAPPSNPKRRPPPLLNRDDSSQESHAFLSVDDLNTTTQVKRQLLESNPVLEAFGNAKTLRNDNSSRFGKYMEIEFNVRGDPKGARIQTYLLEKSRVVRQQKNERNFHIFYQLLSGLPSSQLEALTLKRDPTTYKYLSESGCFTLDNADDARDFKATVHGMQVVGFSEEEIADTWQVLAAILTLGNVEFSSSGKRVGGDAASDAAATASGLLNVATTTVFPSEAAKLRAAEAASAKDKDLRPVLATADTFATVCKLLDVSEKDLLNALTFRTMTVEGQTKETYSISLSVADAHDTRDALTKALYMKLFSWLVDRINANMQWKSNRVRDGKKLIISLLDIYGFEIFQSNGFDQFCINYCNERLQQLAIHLTLESEQREYAEEGIAWVHIEYFDNQAICALIEKKPVGVITILDEECLLPDKTPNTFVRKLGENCSSHPHFASHKISGGNSEFTLRHYAGDVKYLANDFLRKNKDLLFNDLVSLLRQKSNSRIISKLFAEQAEPAAAVANAAATAGASSLSNAAAPGSPRADVDGAAPMSPGFGTHTAKYAPGSALAASKFRELDAASAASSKHNSPAKSPQQSARASRTSVDMGQGKLPLGSTSTAVSAAAGAFGGSRRRPETLAAQFRTQVTALMKTLAESSPHYVRCIKPNDTKSPGVCDVVLLRNQTRYLGLLENVKVRRAGYCFRQSYRAFLGRYKMACPDIWPVYVPGGSGPVPADEHPRDKRAQEHRRAAALAAVLATGRTAAELDREAVERLMLHLDIARTEYEFGKTKIFIKEPVTLVKLERIRERHLGWTATLIQTAYRGFAARRWYKRDRSTRLVQTVCRGFLARLRVKRLRAAIALQTAWRRCAQLRWYKRYRAATVLAATFRGHRDRKEYKKFCAARSLQSTWRMFRDRVVFLKVRTQLRATVMLQKHFRGYQVRKNFHKIKAAAVIQRYVRRWLFRRTLAATFIQKSWKMVRAVAAFRRTRRSILLIQAVYRLHRARSAAIVISKVWRGHRVRARVARWRTARNKIVRFYRISRSRKYFVQLDHAFGQSLPRTPLPAPPTVMKSSCTVLRLESRWRSAIARRYIAALTQEQVDIFRKKALASDIFLGRKENYSLSVKHPFQSDYLQLDNPLQKHTKGWRKLAFGGILEQNMINTELMFSDHVNKLNSKFSVDPATIIVTRDTLYRLHPKNFKPKTKMRLVDIKLLALSPFADDYVLLSTHDSHLIIDCKRYVELVTVLSTLYRKIKNEHLPVSFTTREDFSADGHKWTVSFMAAEKITESKVTILEKKNHVSIQCPVRASASSFNLFLNAAAATVAAGTAGPSSEGAGLTSPSSARTLHA
ncbi:myosin IB [Capsaspora owczarzaki ATCC 30864]|uniref:Myosin IB n=1 Tax=Capsaspora owczarzaki (strain ATCC 30864) TaxID=595528 RepID=A0A0D2VI85_CAPO3|nr:myosin IB [Capsaspora owczarzaki ATCC 30864]KJE89642.1 myosin IB [Capsaspora owczarzaki ATCC 30864]|eukprot:XP_004365949.1 myosin IB [Capsaspora owczarzaki ATCC 30864]